jgi:hypothetical protein
MKPLRALRPPLFSGEALGDPGAFGRVASPPAHSQRPGVLGARDPDLDRAKSGVRASFAVGLEREKVLVSELGGDGCEDRREVLDIRGERKSSSDSPFPALWIIAQSVSRAREFSIVVSCHGRPAGSRRGIGRSSHEAKATVPRTPYGNPSRNIFHRLANAAGWESGTRRSPRAYRSLRGRPLP